MADLIDPKEVVIANRKGAEKTYRISELPAYESREIASQYMTSALPKLGDYPVNEQMSLKMMKFVEAKSGEHWVRLATKDLVNNHCDFKQLASLEKEMVMHNYGFFLNGTALTFFEDIKRKAQALITKTLTDYSASSLTKDVPPSRS